MGQTDSMKLDIITRRKPPDPKGSLMLINLCPTNSVAPYADYMQQSISYAAKMSAFFM